jgi:hypothetical protein
MTHRLAVVMMVLAVAFAPSCGRSRRVADAASASGAAGADADPMGVPSPKELEAYVSGAGAVRLGMSESEVTEALGKKPSRRQDRGDTADVAWDDLKGPRPGAALGSFREGRLLRIEFAPAMPVLPRVDYATADSLTRADIVRGSVDRTLRIADIEAVTRVPGYRATWAIASGFGVKTTVTSRWLWEIEPGGKVLFVDEEDGYAGQPVIRDRR